MRTEGLVAKARDIVNWAIAWTAVTKPEEAEQAQQIVEPGVNPLPDGLSMLNAVGSLSYYLEDRINRDGNRRQHISAHRQPVQWARSIRPTEPPGSQ
jgi:hypothetical protein